MGLIGFYKFFNDIHFTHVILLLGSNMDKYPKIKSGTKVPQNKEWYKDQSYINIHRPQKCNKEWYKEQSYINIQRPQKCPFSMLRWV